MKKSFLKNEDEEKIEKMKMTKINKKCSKNVKIKKSLYLQHFWFKK